MTTVLLQRVPYPIQFEKWRFNISFLIKRFTNHFTLLIPPTYKKSLYLNFAVIENSLLVEILLIAKQKIIEKVRILAGHTEKLTLRRLACSLWTGYRWYGCNHYFWKLPRTEDFFSPSCFHADAFEFWIILSAVWWKFGNCLVFIIISQFL